MRVYLVVVSSVAIAVGFASWLRSAGRGLAALGMALAVGPWLWKRDAVRWVPTAAILGMLAGLLLWIVDSFTNSGDPITRWQQASP